MHLWVIVGATATGKTTLAAKLAHHLNADLISADSRQVYRGLDLGTGKDLQEFQNFSPPIRYHLIDIVNADHVYSLYQYQQACYAEIDRIHKIGQGNRTAAVLVGGTGMYIEAVLRRYQIANVTENPELRKSLETKTNDELIGELQKVDANLAGRTDLSSRKRIIRAHIIYLASLSSPVEYSPQPPTDFTFQVFALAWERNKLRARIDQRLQERVGQGMIGEVQKLLEQGITSERLRLLGMEYREITDYLTGVKSFDQMLHDLAHEIHLLAKRQETYFRGFEKRGIPIQWLQPESSWDTILSIIAKPNSEAQRRSPTAAQRPSLGAE